MFGSLGYSEILLFGVVALIMFGSRLPEVARNLGGSYRDLRKHLTDFQKEFQDVGRYEPPSKPNYDKEEVESPPSNKPPRFIPPPADDQDA